MIGSDKMIFIFPSFANRRSSNSFPRAIVADTNVFVSSVNLSMLFCSVCANLFFYILLGDAFLPCCLPERRKYVLEFACALYLAYVLYSLEYYISIYIVH